MWSFPHAGIAGLALALACGAPPSPRAPAAPAPKSERSEDERCEALFGRVDANGDGLVSEPEFSTLRHPVQENSHTTFVLRDQSQDGALSSEEFCAPVRVALIL